VAGGRFSCQLRQFHARLLNYVVNRQEEFGLMLQPVFNRLRRFASPGPEGAHKPWRARTIAIRTSGSPW